MGFHGDPPPPPCWAAVFATAVVVLTDVSDWFLTPSSHQAKKLGEKGFFDAK